MENIFKGAKFGDKYLTKDHKIALYIGMHTDSSNRTFVGMEIESVGQKHYQLSGELYDGSCSLDIVSKYKEPINEEKLRDKAYKWTKFVKGDDLMVKLLALECAMIGYRKAKEE